MKNASVVLVFALAISGNAFADDQTTAAEGQTKLKVEEAKEKKNTVSGDLDQEITNAKLRAESGSKSKWSASATVNYAGASLEKPFDKYRPNPTQDPVPQRVTVGGSVEGRYRLNKNNSISGGTGYSLETPIQGGGRGYVSTPYLSYSNARKIGKVQNITGLQLSVATAADDLTVGTYGAGEISDTLMYDFNGSRFSVGMALAADYTLYKNNKNEMIRLAGDDESSKAGLHQIDYELAAYPMAEYALSDAISLRTVFRPWIYSHNVFKDGWTFKKRPWTQSFGVGWAVTRDIYLYPNFQWNWEDWRGRGYSFADKTVRSNTTVALAATLNVF